MLSRINGLIVFCCGVLCATPAESKVCFAGDSDCGGIETFGGYVDPSENLKNQCAKAGYETNRSECTVSKGMQVTDYCPYDSNYVKCCSLDYQYDSCVYPMVQAGKCGNKYKCVCDSSKYKYTAESCRSNFANSNASGASCAQVEYNASAHTTSTKIFFTDCSCNEALYPYKPEDCKDGTAPTGDVCYSVNVNGVRAVRYSACLCNRDVYQYSTNYCDNPSSDRWGGDDSRKCIQGGVTYFANCLTCGSSYPNTNKDNVSGVACRYLSDVKRTGEAIDSSRIVTIEGTQYYKPYASATCGYVECPYGPRYKALNCKFGYEVKNGVCTLMACRKIINLFTEKYPNYVLIDNLDPRHPSSAPNVVVASDEIKSNGSRVVTKIPLGDSCSFNRGLRCSAAMKYISASKLAQSSVATGELGDAMKLACTEDATLEMSGSYFPYDSAGREGRLTFEGINLKFTSNTVKVSRDLDVIDGDITSSHITFLRKVHLTSKDVLRDFNFGYGTVKFSSVVKSTGYNFTGNGTIEIANENFGNTVMFAGVGTGGNSRATIKAGTLKLKGIAGFKGIVGNVKEVYIGRYQGEPNKGPQVKYSVMSLYNTDWYFYDPSSTSYIIPYTLYMSSGTVMGLFNDGNSRILFNRSDAYRTINTKTREKHGKNGTHSCKNHTHGPFGDNVQYYINASGELVSEPLDRYLFCQSKGSNDNPGYWDWLSVTNSNRESNGSLKPTFHCGGWHTLYFEAIK